MIDYRRLAEEFLGPGYYAQDNLVVLLRDVVEEQKEADARIAEDTILGYDPENKPVFANQVAANIRFGNVGAELEKEIKS